MKRDSKEFFRKMRCKWYFRNNSEKPAFNVKSNWNLPNSHLALELFLSKLKNEVFFVLPGTPRDYNLPKKEWLAIIKPANKGSCVVLWELED